jgi:hypothetical protein
MRETNTAMRYLDQAVTEACGIAKRELGWSLRYPSWRSGFVAAYTSPLRRNRQIAHPAGSASTGSMQRHVPRLNTRRPRAHIRDHVRRSAPRRIAESRDRTARTCPPVETTTSLYMRPGRPGKAARLSARSCDCPESTCSRRKIRA